MGERSQKCKQGFWTKKMGGQTWHELRAGLGGARLGVQFLTSLKHVNWTSHQAFGYLSSEFKKGLELLFF